MMAPSATRPCPLCVGPEEDPAGTACPVCGGYGVVLPIRGASGACEPMPPKPAPSAPLRWWRRAVARVFGLKR